MAGFLEHLLLLVSEGVGYLFEAHFFFPGFAINFCVLLEVILKWQNGVCGGLCNKKNL